MYTLLLTACLPVCGRVYMYVFWELQAAQCRCMEQERAGHSTRREGSQADKTRREEEENAGEQQEASRRRERR